MEDIARTMINISIPKTLHFSPFRGLGGLLGGLSGSLLLLCIILLTSCGKWESYSAGADARLTFSTDTVAFDTLISTIPSATKTCYAFNHNSDGMRISSIYLEKGAQSLFRVNVDGRFLSGGRWEDFQVLAHDSLIIRVEMTPPAAGSPEPVSFTDRLIFQLQGGGLQSVVLKGGSMDAHIVKGLIIETSQALATDLPYVIYDSLVVPKDFTLTLAAGTRLMFHDKAALHVYGTLQVEGTAESPVILRGDRMDHMFDYLPYDNTPSRWEGVIIHKGSYGNRFTQCDLHSARFGIKVEDNCIRSVDPVKPSVIIENSILHNIGGDGLQLNNCCSRVINTQISNTLGHCVNITSGVHDFIYCTLAQFYPFSADRGMALNLKSSENDDTIERLQQANFVNCVITGYGDDVIMGDSIITDDYTCDFLFHHCFLLTPTTDDEHFVSCIFEGKDQPLRREANFVRFDADNFIYDFTPKEESSIRSLADGAYPGLPTTDRMGNPRTGDEGPDAGCYEFIPKEEEAPEP